MSGSAERKADPFWEENAKLSIEEIENNFNEKTAAALKAQKAAMERK